MSLARSAFFGCTLLVCFGCKDAPVASQRRESAVEMVLQQEPLQPLPRPLLQNPKQVALGAALFTDRRLSADGQVSCSSCHELAKAGQDGRAVSFGVHGLAGNINAPSVLNSSLNFVQFWDGRAATLEEQAGGPLTNPVEMGGNWPAVLTFLKGDPSYREQFGLAFRDGVTETNTRAALAAYERTLITPDSRFDRWLRGEQSAITGDEIAGYERFKSVGCIACHQGANVGGNMFQRFGVMGEYFEDRGHITAADYGRFNVTHVEEDRFVFKVPSLRNVALTAPYFHDGSAATLEQAVGTMARYQLGQRLDAAAIGQIVGFLKTLTGRLPEPSVQSQRLAERLRP